jgi:hypothetical protein
MSNDVEALMQELWDRRLESPELKAKIERLTKERDEARREVCNLMYQKGFPTGDYAKGRGWDCFKEAQP